VIVLPIHFRSAVSSATRRSDLVTAAWRGISESRPSDGRTGSDSEISDYGLAPWPNAGCPWL